MNTHTCNYCGTITEDDIFCPQCGTRWQDTHEEPVLAYDQLGLQVPAYTVNGIDISVYNGTMDWSVTAKTNARFAYMRGDIGKGIDPQLDDNAAGARTEKFPWGIYHVPKPASSTNWKEQVSIHADLEMANDPPLLPWFDAELDGGLDKLQLGDWFFKYLKRFEELTGKSMIIYTRASWWDSHVYRNDWAKAHLLAVAHYTSAPAPTIPNDWGAIHQPKTWTFWQHSAGGNGLGAQYGCQSTSIDLNRFNGDDAAFLKLFKVAPRDLSATPPQPPVPTVGLKMRVGVPVLNIRSGPGTHYPDVGDLHANDVVPVLKVAGANAWVQIGDGRWACVQLGQSVFLLNE